jgi:hypothetical protein
MKVEIKRDPFNPLKIMLSISHSDGQEWLNTSYTHDDFELLRETLNSFIAELKEEERNKLPDAMILLMGSKNSYHCENCGANVFKKIAETPKSITYSCNGCREEYKGYK